MTEMNNFLKKCLLILILERISGRVCWEKTSMWGKWSLCVMLAITSRTLIGRKQKAVTTVLLWESAQHIPWHTVRALKAEHRVDNGETMHILSSFSFAVKWKQKEREGWGEGGQNLLCTKQQFYAKLCTKPSEAGENTVCTLCKCSDRSTDWRKIHLLPD